MAIALRELWLSDARIDGSIDSSDRIVRLGRIQLPGETHPQVTSDAALVERLAHGDVSAFDALVITYDAPLRRFARRMVDRTDLADDIVQDVFVWIWERRDSLNVTGTLRAYLYGAVRHQLLHRLRRERIEDRCALTFDVDTIPGMGTAPAATPAAAERAELANALARALNTLSPRVRHVALLRWRDHLSRAEIAAIMGVAVPTINNQLTHAARAVRALLGPFDPSSSGAEAIK